MLVSTLLLVIPAVTVASYSPTSSTSTNTSSFSSTSSSSSTSFFLRNVRFLWLGCPLCMQLEPSELETFGPQTYC